MTDEKRNSGEISRDLVKTWRGSRPFFDGLEIHQIVGVAGDGKLGDGKESSRQLRAFLAEVPLAHLRRYAEECLSESFAGSGFALQDIVNQVGRRLGFKVDDGRYRGAQNTPGQDGVWQLPDGRVIVVEVKTTDAYRIELDTPAAYREALLKSRPELSGKSVSVLLVVGRQDTGGLEAQIRGSRHAWDMRVISVDALLKIAEIKEKVEEPTFQRIHEVLIPKEFTRLDEIAELVLSTASDSSTESDEEGLEDSEEEEAAAATVLVAPAPVAAAKSIPRKPLGPFSAGCLAKAEADLKSRREIAADLIRRSRTNFSTPDEARGVVCITSRNYAVNDRVFWFGLSDPQQDFLNVRERGWLVLGGDSGKGGTVFLIPWKEFARHVPALRGSRKRNPPCAFIDIREETLVTMPGHDDVDLSGYLLRADDES